MFIKDTMKILDTVTNEKYDCFTQSVDLNFNGKYVMRYNIGINGYNEWSNICCVYSNDDFNKRYKVLSN